MFCCSFNRSIIFIYNFSIGILNEIMFYSGILGDETFNMFFISPYFQTTLPVYCNIQPKVPYPIFLFLYIFPYITVALGIHAAIYPLPRLIAHSKSKKATKVK